MKQLGVLSLISLLLIGCQSGQRQVPTYPGYTLVFADEFDGTRLNTANWSYREGDGCPDLCGWGNKELQWYRPENTTVSGGNLIITAKEERFEGRDYTSSQIISRHKQDFRHGRIEASIKLPRGDGMWPAFWMMSSDDVYGTWAASGEIDIMEAKNTPMEIRGNLHFGGEYPDNTKTGSSAYADGSDFSQDYHLYSIEWDPKEIRWYCDNNLYKSTDVWWTGSKEDNGTFPAPFDQRFYILLNVAVGGTYMDCFVPECITAEFPQKMYVDYVRVYQKTD